LLSAFFCSLYKRDDFIHECLVQNAVRLPDHERQLFAEQNVGGKFQVTSLAFLFGVRFVGDGSFRQRRRWSTVLGTCYYFTFTMPGGFQVPSPGGRIEGGSVFGQ